MISFSRPTIRAPASIRQFGCGTVRGPPYIWMLIGISVRADAEGRPLSPGQASIESLGRGAEASSAAAAPGIPAMFANVANQLRSSSTCQLSCCAASQHTVRLHRVRTLRRGCSLRTSCLAQLPAAVRQPQTPPCGHLPGTHSPCPRVMGNYSRRKPPPSAQHLQLQWARHYQPPTPAVCCPKAS